MAQVDYLEYSNRDMKYAEGMFGLGYYDPCGRFCQQSIEKRLKHYIELYGATDDFKFLHTHNLGRLYVKVCEIAAVAPNPLYRGYLAQLTDYYFDTNYPTAINIELTEEMAREAIDIAKEVNAWVDSALEAAKNNG
ncbi:MAG: HEPN domain-containing protein [Defluviitaleaceae bacterium]|nr:HEPN domain-containing protein [Defluviitaleaceae bacterium]